MEDNMELFWDIFQDNPRQGPGNGESTQKAFKMIPPLYQPTILDIGCGAGIQTINLAHLTNGNIIALDNHQPVLDRLNAKIAGEQLADRVQTVNASMFELPFQRASFDLIWSEGSIFIIGFENGLQYWKPYLKPGGYLALTELSWLQENPPEKVQDYFKEVYPEMLNRKENLAIIENQGYRDIGHFVLPIRAWWDDFYNPLEKRLDIFRVKCTGDKEAMSVINAVQAEIDLYRDYADWYGYVFYIMQSIDPD